MTWAFNIKPASICDVPSVEAFVVESFDSCAVADTSGLPTVMPRRSPLFGAGPNSDNKRRVINHPPDGIIGVIVENGVSVEGAPGDDFDDERYWVQIQQASAAADAEGPDKLNFSPLGGEEPGTVVPATNLMECRPQSHSLAVGTEVRLFPVKVDSETMAYVFASLQLLCRGITTDTFVVTSGSTITVNKLDPGTLDPASDEEFNILVFNVGAGSITIPANTEIYYIPFEFQAGVDGVAVGIEIGGSAFPDGTEQYQVPVWTPGSGWVPGWVRAH
jgi:hypothetical protein